MPTILPWLWTFACFMSFTLIIFFKNHQVLGSCDYERLGHEEAHDIPKKEEPTDTIIFSNLREAARRALCWDLHDAPWEVTTASHVDDGAYGRSQPLNCTTVPQFWRIWWLK